MISFKKIVFVFFITSFFSLHAQVQLSVYSQVSIITVGAGDELYEAFGHSAIRIKDPVLNFDLIYNYGVFDFDAPNFYTNFTKGKLLYKLVRYDFDIFLQGYQQEKRWMKEQVLNLTPAQKTKFLLYLEHNAQPENATYLYDPFFNNCASKLVEVTKDILQDDFVINTNNFEKDETLRTLMNQRIHWNTWGNFGINVALGNKLDVQRNPIEFKYLPDYVYQLFKDSNLKTADGLQPIVLIENKLLSYEAPPIEGQFLGPLLFLMLISIFILYITYADFKHQKITFLLDKILFFALGLIGLLLVFLWFFTNHTTTQNNFNILWAFMPNLLMFFMFSKKKLMVFYYQFLILLLLLLMVLWILKIQSYSVVLIPFLVALLFRYTFVQFALKKFD